MKNNTCYHACHHLDYADVNDIKRELLYLQKQDEYRALLIQRATEEIERLKKENHQLKEEYNTLKQKYKLLHQSQFKSNKNSNIQDDGTEDASDNNKTKEPQKKKKKRGAPRGHRGATRKKPSHADKYIKVSADDCPHCHNKNLSECNYHRNHFQEDIILAVNTITTCFQHPYYYCNDCQRVFTSGPAEKELPLHTLIKNVSGFANGLKNIKTSFSLSLIICISPLTTIMPNGKSDLPF